MPLYIGNYKYNIHIPKEDYYNKTISKILDGTIEEYINNNAKTLTNKFAFMGASKLSYVEMKKCSFVCANAFAECVNLDTIDFPQCRIIGETAFRFCTKLSSVDIHSCESIGAAAFAGCSNLSEISLPFCENVGTNAFLDCINISDLSLPACSYIGANAFLGCNNLMSLQIDCNSVCTLENINAFNNTPMSDSTYTGSFGSIYVPSSMLSAYKNATNWSVYSDRFVGI